MFPNILLCSSNIERKRKKKRAEFQTAWRNLETGIHDPPDFPNAVPFYGNPIAKTTTARLSLSSDHFTHSFKGGSCVKAERKKKKGEAIMSKVSTFSDLIQRVTASCLLHPLASADRHQTAGLAAEEVYEYETDEHERERNGDGDDDDEDEDEEEEEGGGGIGFGNAWEGSMRRTAGKKSEGVAAAEMEALMVEVFEAAAAMKKAYVRLQEAHCPWDADKMRNADAAVVAEMRRIGVLRERFRRTGYGGGGVGGMTAATVREVVAPYEAAVEELRWEVKSREAEVETLKEKLKSFAATGGGGAGAKKGRSLSRKKVSCIQSQVPMSPSPEMFEMTMTKVNEGLKSFTSLLLSLMKTAHWDIAAAVRSIEAASADSGGPIPAPSSGAITPQHAKYALESYVSRKVFQGFNHETFYMDGSLTSLLNPDQFRRDCFTQYRDMKAMDPAELLSILPSCHFGKFCSKKYLAVVHPKMEESLFGNLEQHRQAVAGSHPRSEFYGEFLRLAKAVWLLHLLAFSLDPMPSQFEASRGAEYHPQYMESVVKLPGGRLPPGLVVGLPVSPGFKMWDGSVIKAMVYLVSSRS